MTYPLLNGERAASRDLAFTLALVIRRFKLAESLNIRLEDR
jgi:hypothetical protein